MYGVVLKYNLAKMLKVIEVIVSTCKTNGFYDRSHIAYVNTYSSIGH